MKELKLALLSVIFILGYTNLSYELIILRQLVNFLGANLLITSIVMAFVLLFLSVGYYCGSVVSFKKHLIRKINVKLLWMLAIWFMISTHYDVVLFFFALIDRLKMPIAETFLFSLFWLVFPSVATGFVSASIGRVIHFLNKNYTGRFMAVDTMGSVLGSLVTTLILMPLIGVSATVFALVLLTAFSSILIARKKDLLWSICLFMQIILASYVVNVYLPNKNQPYLIKEDTVSRLEIIPNEKEKSKLMMINGSYSSKIASDRENMFQYVQFINSFIQQLPKNKVHKILVLGAGGFTVGLDDEQNEYTYLDIEPQLQEISENYFLDKPLGKNKKFIAQDAYFYMLKNKQKYDVILLDVYSSRKNIPIDFVTKDFLSLSKGSLNLNGYLMANIITSATFENAFSRRIDNTFRAVFPCFLSRQIIGSFQLADDKSNNVLYMYHHLPVDDVIYTQDKNTAMYGQF